MRRSIRIAGIGLIAIVALLQLIQPERNHGNVNPEDDLLILAELPDSLVTILRNSCSDCHSNHTDYPWYSYIAPFSWYLETHIRKGKEEVNFSNFGSLGKSQKVGALVDICEVLESGSMPLNSYLLIHRNAKISKDEKEAICNWTELEAMRLLRE